MSVLLVYSFLALFFSIQLKRSNQSKLENILITIVLFSVGVVFSSEVLSFYKILNYKSLLLFWVFISVGFTFFLYKSRVLFYAIFRQILTNVKSSYKSLSMLSKMILFSVFVLIFLVFIQGVIYPPNNWDSLSYHMTRTYHWMNHESFKNFPTHIIRQLYQPCLSEYFIFQVNLLNGNDYLSNTVQLSFFLFSIIALICIVRQLGIANKYVFPTIILGLTLPEALMQASSTQNDIVHSFFILLSALFLIRTFNNPSIFNYFFLGNSIGLALLSKAIAYVYLPILVLFFGLGVFIKLVKYRNWLYLKNSLITVLMVVLINVGHTSRNLAYSGDIMGTDKKESEDYLCTEFSFKNTLSITSKNIGLHLDPFFVGDIGNILIEKFHILMGEEINKPSTNLFDIKFTCKPGLNNHEDFQPNFIVLLLFGVSSILLVGLFFKSVNNFENRRISLYIVIIFIQFIFFCTLLLWEPWNTRLHLPLFFLEIPIIVFAFHKFSAFYKIRYLIYLVAIIYSFAIVLFNFNRPFITNEKTSKIQLTDARFKKYFSNNLSLYPEYVNCVSILKRENIKSVGMIINIDTWEYPLYCNFLDSKIKSQHLLVNNLTKDIPNSNEKVECILSDTINKSVVEFKGVKFYNKTGKNKHIWLYLN